MVAATSVISAAVVVGFSVLGRLVYRLTRDVDRLAQRISYLEGKATK